MLYKEKLDKYFENWTCETDVIVVGGSPSLTWYEFGKYIDQFTTVIRINKCFHDNMYNFTGKKINIWGTTNNERWNKFNPITKDTYEVWGRRDCTCDEFKENGTFDDFDGKCFGAQDKHPQFEWHGIGTGLICLNHAISKFNKITIIGHTFYLEGNEEAINFYSKKEDDEHKQNRLDYYNGDTHRLNQLSHVLNWIKEDKIILLNPYEYDNLNGITK